MQVVPISLKDANAYVEQLHRHHQPVVRDKWRIAVADRNGKIVGIAQVGRPISRMLDDGQTLEVLRCCTDGTHNACSFLYSHCAKIAKCFGYKKIITYILETENGTSLKASGWVCDDSSCGGGSWSRPSRTRETIKAPVCKKQRWVKVLKE